MNKQKTLSIVIVNWNAGQQLWDCVSSIAIAQKADFVLTEIIIVDNDSADGSLEGIDQLGMSIRIIRNKSNLGFGAACNQGAAGTSSDYLLFLNPDTRLFENSLSIPLEFMQQTENINVGIVGIQLIDENNHIARSCARFPKLMMFIAQSLGIIHLPGLRHLSVHMIEWGHDTTQQVDHVMGAFFLMQRSLFKSLGGFDERFFVYLEDLDLSLRARQAGWRSIYLTDARAFHVGGGTSNQVKAKRLFYSLRSRILYVFKHFNLFSAILVLLTTLFIESLSRSALAVGRGSWVSLKETWSAYYMLIRWLPDLIFKEVTR